VYVDQAKQSYEGQSAHLIQGVLAHLLGGAEALFEADGDGTSITSAERDAVARLGKFRPRPNDSKYARAMRVTDYLSAMTDRFLLRTVDELDELGYFSVS
jgi:dGTP triphosphohydrolase